VRHDDPDVINADGTWVDRPVVRSTESGWTLITSRSPGDLQDFAEAISEELAKTSSTG
jgi:protease I